MTKPQKLQPVQVASLQEEHLSPADNNKSMSTLDCNEEAQTSGC
jgi:hypothetical protein